jgi:hypothetical protein
MKKIFFTTFLITTTIFFFFAPWNYFAPCYGHVCIDASSPTIFSKIPNFMQPWCSGFCNSNNIPKTFFSPYVLSPYELIIDILYALIVSILISIGVKLYRKENIEKFQKIN